MPRVFMDLLVDFLRSPCNPNAPFCLRYPGLLFHLNSGHGILKGALGKAKASMWCAKKRHLNSGFKYMKRNIWFKWGYLWSILLWPLITNLSQTYDWLAFKHVTQHVSSFSCVIRHWSLKPEHPANLSTTYRPILRQVVEADVRKYQTLGLLCQGSSRMLTVVWVEGFRGAFS